MRWRPLVEWVGFQAVWLACAMGAAAQLNWPGVSSAALFLGLHLLTHARPGSESGTILATGLLGALAESSFSAAGLVIYAAASPGTWAAPAWIVALWLAFGATLASLEALLGARSHVVVSLVGLVTGPLSYLAGARLGAIEFPDSAAVALAATAVLWALALPLLLGVRRAFYR